MNDHSTDEKTSSKSSEIATLANAKLRQDPPSSQTPSQHPSQSRAATRATPTSPDSPKPPPTSLLRGEAEIFQPASLIISAAEKESRSFSPRYSWQSESLANPGNKPDSSSPFQNDRPYYAPRLLGHPHNVDTEMSETEPFWHQYPTWIPATTTPTIPTTTATTHTGEKVFFQRKEKTTTMRYPFPLSFPSPSAENSLVAKEKSGNNHPAGSKTETETTKKKKPETETMKKKKKRRQLRRKEKQNQQKLNQHSRISSSSSSSVVVITGD
ncbi:uncharacterized protein SEPMUDRAFT_119098 [Sphaerulina musiva SO2202]|uniref:Uncharacterized protein n=1 Tax=Sphaerulina musiva (strain SO2202) TaxID=692275 RepID=N1QE30_SPHMS|nr:uncharacterized protein SEPMUDRAFT_119098 [Sphaerulina musiva SO2202]EMF10556.1 hypothetical protein SEPMUDRAFT_119098 [Sphaerulina musiva SO2202]